MWMSMMVRGRCCPSRIIRRNVLTCTTTTTITPNTTIRNHMNHSHGHHGHGGGGGGGSTSGVGLKRRTSTNDDETDALMMAMMPPSSSGPRFPMTIGLEASEATQNILRLIESYYLMSSSLHFDHHDNDNNGLMAAGVWHPTAGVRWIHNDETRRWTPIYAHDHDHDHHHNNSRTTAGTTTSMSRTRPTSTSSTVLFEPPQIWSLQLADARTALVHVVQNSSSSGNNGGQRQRRRQAFLSLLRITSPIGQADNAALYNGWRIVRSVEVVPPTTTPTPDTSTTTTSTSSSSSSYAEIAALVQTYWDIEHGGGPMDATTARDVLFDPRASLVTIGQTTTTTDLSSSAWSAPLGSLLEIPLATYLQGVQSQTPHDRFAHYRCQDDELIAIRLIPGQQMAAAAVELRVGNGTGDTIFHDHLLLGKTTTTTPESNNDDNASTSTSSWKILSKTFSVQKNGNGVRELR